MSVTLKMKQTFVKQLVTYVFGVFLLSIGVTFSILSKTGVPPIASFPYAITLISGISMGVTTIMTHAFFLSLQVILLRKFDVKNILIQVIIALLLGSFFDLAAWLLQIVPDATTYFHQGLYLAIGILISACGIFFFFSANLPMNPYDTLTRVLTQLAKRPYGVVRIYSDVSVVIIALTISLIGLHSMGSVGIGTIISAYMIGKIVGMIIRKFQSPLQKWMFKEREVAEAVQQGTAK